ncbi:MAG: sensor histidine kinase, partial [Clostridia bacterium]|nr:sensor histidine kinase [Clostridia bacterium]
LFDRFRRGDASHNGAIPGFGIGLSMAQSITEAHNGKIEAFSSDGKSLTITVKL